MDRPPIHHLGASALAQKIVGGELSAVEVLEAHIARIEATAADLNAVVVRRYGAAREEAQEADRRRASGRPLGPLHGVPISIKECLDLRGAPSTFGLPSRAGSSAGADERHVARLREAGAIVVAKTNVAQLLLYFETDNPLYGRTQNPWDLSRSPGGSSGGEAALIAAGGSPLGVGTDLAGSLRNPAAACGLASLKPTAGRLPDDGRFSLPWGQRAVASQVGFMAREVADLRLALRVANGGEHPPAPGLALENAAQSPQGLRVGFFEDDGFLPATPAAKRAVREAAEHLRAQGAQVTPWQPPALHEAQAILFGIFSADAFKGLVRSLGKDPMDPRIADLRAGGTLPPLVAPLARRILRAIGRRKIADIAALYGRGSAHEYWDLVERQRDYQSAFSAAMDGAPGGPLDLLLCPPAPVPAIKHGDTLELATLGLYTALFNVLGYPAGVVPVTTVRPGEDQGRALDGDRMTAAARRAELGSAGLPVGVQVAARPWKESLLLMAMEAIQKSAASGAGYPRLPMD